VLVTEVPMLAPMMIGTASLGGTMLAPTMLMTMEVKVELDCTETVPKIPIIKPKTGLEKSESSLKSSPATRRVTI